MVKNNRVPKHETSGGTDQHNSLRNKVLLHEKWAEMCLLLVAAQKQRQAPSFADIPTGGRKSVKL